MNFAAGVPDDNPRYLDDRRGRLCAPPTYPCSLTWRLSRLLPQRFSAELVPEDSFARQFHVIERLDCLRPLHVGETIQVRGLVAALRWHSAGCLLIVRYEGTDQERHCAFIEHHGVILQGVGCEEAGNADEVLERIACVGKDIESEWRTVVKVGALACHQYDAGADIEFPLHTSPLYARSRYNSEIILHGTCTLALVVREIVSRELEGDASRITSISARFTAPVRPGQSIAVDARAIEDGYLACVTNEDGGTAARVRVHTR